MRLFYYREIIAKLWKLVQATLFYLRTFVQLYKYFDFGSVLYLFKCYFLCFSDINLFVLVYRSKVLRQKHTVRFSITQNIDDDAVWRTQQMKLCRAIYLIINLN